MTAEFMTMKNERGKKKKDREEYDRLRNEIINMCKEALTNLA